MALTERTRIRETSIRPNADGTLDIRQTSVREVLLDGEVISYRNLPTAPLTDADLDALLGTALAATQKANGLLKEQVKDLQKGLADLRKGAAGAE